MSLLRKKSQTVPSPCVDICALDDDDVCIGCYRSGDEITTWGKMSDDEKKQTLQKVRERRSQK
jgi:predicted Fe-S protein YdhL (DUF1289 family)